MVKKLFAQERVLHPSITKEQLGVESWRTAPMENTGRVVAVTCVGAQTGIRREDIGVVRKNKSSKLFVVGRADISPGMRAAQMFHAARLFASEFPYIEQEWFRRSNTIVLLEVSDREALEELQSKAVSLAIASVGFSEPDFLDVGVTALCMGPDARKLVGNLRLAFS